MKIPNIRRLVEIAYQDGIAFTMRFIRQYEPEEIIAAIASISNTKDDPAKLANQPTGIRIDNSKISTFLEIITDIKENSENYLWVSECLKDDNSKRVFNSLILSRIFPNKQFIKLAFDNNPQYFDKDIVSVNENEIFVDCGGYTGDTVQSYMEHMKLYKHIYVYEPDAANISKCKENLKNLKGITISQAGVGEKSETLTFVGTQKSGAFVNDENAKGERINIISLDEDISEPITFLKMDVEGFEIDAINGAARHIREEKPKLAICIYHLITDFWKIPQLIHSLNPEYDFYIRHYHPTEFWETVLYAV